MAKQNNRRPLSPSELSAFCSQISLILKAGISVQEGISIMEDDNQNAFGEEILKIIREHAQIGEGFSTCLEAAGVFPKYMLDMVHIGEQSGRLEEVMDSLSDYYERNEAISKSIKSAVTYPALMIIMMLVVIGILIIKVLPIFNEVFAQLGSQMSSMSQGIMRFGMVLNRYSAVIIALLAIVVIVMLIVRKTSGGAHFFAGLFHRFPGTRKLAEKISAGRFASAMALMLSSGLDVDDSLSMAKELVEDEHIKSKVAQCQENIAGGTSFSEALTQAGIFPAVYARMISVGFKTGSVDGVMKKIADRYEVEVGEQIDGLISVLEPTLVAILSIIVGMILLSVMLPLMGIMSSIG